MQQALYSAPGEQVGLATIATHGGLCLVAMHSVRRAVDLHRFFWRELTLIGGRFYQRTDFERADGLMKVFVDCSGNTP